MDAHELKRIATGAARSLPASRFGQPFGPDYDVFKVSGKVFMMTTKVPGLQIVTLKCDPGRSMILRELYPTVTPGYHMNKQHWISISAASDITAELIGDLVEHSYALVVRSVPLLKRPSPKTCDAVSGI